MTFVGQALSDKIAEGLTLQCDFCRTGFVNVKIDSGIR